MTMWAVVEILGHRTRAGTISDCQIGGGTLLRIEHPTVADETGEEPLTEYYSPSAIFAIRPCSQAEATRVAHYSWCTPKPAGELSPVFDEFIEDDERDRDEERYNADLLHGGDS